MDAGIVFGPALVRSFLLEHDYAVYPRIVIDPALMQTPLPGLWRDQIRRGEDGIHFCDYLFLGFFDRYDHAEGLTHWEALQNHKQAVERQLELAREKPPRVKQKIFWLANYHNNAIDRITERFKNVDMNSKTKLDSYRVNDEGLVL